jgi:hypothetical protein
MNHLDSRLKKRMNVFVAASLPIWPFPGEESSLRHSCEKWED